MILLSEEIYTNIIINMLPIQYNYSISKKIENLRLKKIKTSIEIINRNIYKYIVERDEYRNTDFYNIPKYAFRKFYPLNKRKELLKNNIHIEYIEFIELRRLYEFKQIYKNKLYIDILFNPNHLVINFNKFIDSMSQDYLNEVTW